MLDVGIWDTITPQNLLGGGWDESKPIGGSEKQAMLLKRHLETAGVSVGFGKSARTMIVHRYSRFEPYLFADCERVILLAQDKEPYPKYARVNSTVFVSEWQAKQHGWDKTCDRVIHPFLEPLEPTACALGRFIYPSAPVKGLQATLEAWSQSPHSKDHLVVCNTYSNCDDRMRGICASHNATWLGQVTAQQLRQQIALSEGLFMVNTYAECFPMVVHMAYQLKRKIYVRCQGHAPCGVVEAQREYEGDTALTNKWLEALGL